MKKNYFNMFEYFAFFYFRAIRLNKVLFKKKYRDHEHF